MSSDDSSISKGEYEVEAIVNDRKKKYYDKKSKTYKFMKEYLIKWVGYKKKTWEPEENLENCREMLLQYKINKRNELKKNQSKTPVKQNILKIIKIQSPIKFKTSSYLTHFSDITDKEERNNVVNNDNEENYNDDNKSALSLETNTKTKKKSSNEQNASNNILSKSKQKQFIINGNESPFSNKTIKNEYFSESTFDPLNNIENINENSILRKNLEKKRKRSESSSDYSISIDDPFMKTENTSQNYSSFNHLYNNDFMGISEIIIPKNENEKISLLYTIKNNNKKLLFKGTSSDLNIPKNEIINCYEKILMSYLGGKNINFQ